MIQTQQGSLTGTMVEHSKYVNGKNSKKGQMVLWQA
jgi:hypothetical protein